MFLLSVIAVTCIWRNFLYSLSFCVGVCACVCLPAHSFQSYKYQGLQQVPNIDSLDKTVPQLKKKMLK